MSGRNPTDALSSVQVALNRVVLPPKKYFKIGEVAHLVGVEPHVLRYWQTQFPQVRPQKSRSGHRLYRRRDVETLLAVKELLHVQRFTIAGARQALRMAMVNSGTPSELPSSIDSSPPSLIAGPESAYDDVDDEPLDDDDERAANAEASEPDLTELELVARDGAELVGALEEQWAEHYAVRRGELEAVDVEARDDVPRDNGAHGLSTEGNGSSHASARALNGDGAQERASERPQNGAHTAGAPGLARSPLESAQALHEPRARIAVVVEDGEQPSRAADREIERSQERRAQLGFGFSASARAALLEAREELHKALGTLDGYAAERRRHTAGRR